jgi:hypothetical protein
MTDSSSPPELEGTLFFLEDILSARPLHTVSQSQVDDKSGGDHWTPQTAIPFGKHKGRRLQDVPVGYLRWLGGYEWDNDKRNFVTPLDLDEELTFDATHASTSLDDHHTPQRVDGRHQVRGYFQSNKLCLGCGKPSPPTALPETEWSSRNLHRECFLSHCSSAKQSSSTTGSSNYKPIRSTAIGGTSTASTNGTARTFYHRGHVSNRGSRSGVSWGRIV